MKQGWKSLAALTAGCTFAAALFGFGADVFAFRSSYEGLGREPLILVARLLAYLALALVLVFRGGWPGVFAAVVMAVAATTVEWVLFPLAFDWAALSNPLGYRDEFGNVGRPSYARFGAVYDIIGIGISAVLAQGLHIMASATPQGPRDE